MKNKYHFLIKDARGGFRVQQIAGNGEILNTSQVLDTVDAVYKNILAVLCVADVVTCPSAYRTKKLKGNHIYWLTRWGICVLYKGKKQHLFKELFQ